MRSRTPARAITGEPFNWITPLQNLLNELEPLQLHPVAADLCEVVLSLLHQPALLAGSKDLREPNGHLTGYTALPVHQFRKRVACHAQDFGETPGIQ